MYTSDGELCRIIITYIAFFKVGQSSRRGSMLINLVTSIRPKDAFSLFGSGEIPKIETTSDDNTRQEAKLGSGGKSQECSQWFGKETETEQVLETITKEAVKERCVVLEFTTFTTRSPNHQ